MTNYQKKAINRDMKLFNKSKDQAENVGSNTEEELSSKFEALEKKTEEELSSKFEALETKTEELETKAEALDAKVKELEQQNQSLANQIEKNENQFKVELEKVEQSASQKAKEMIAAAGHKDVAGTNGEEEKETAFEKWQKLKAEGKYQEAQAFFRKNVDAIEKSARIFN